ncbi:hypothetical protein AUJ66_04390 [Candidatus Desantisbacteria bacterium CG1_02_38_46]|uniref:Antitoxin n=1 Tax=Candidatus Desantisbacteria bacterium CG1_02_38_46 TaxID=1817893 RepID=A0A1J4SCA7_9BACT|nr:MAG: hypothetical protein AUJ66_04390 [Candidatus Desantisbacteria bacterium CG1_02_38_46]
MKKLKKLPEFKNEEEEFEFWSTHDSTEYLDWNKAKRAIFPNLRPTMKLISVRIPVLMIERLKLLANKRDVPYQSLIKIFLMRGINEELKTETLIRK